MKSTISQEYSLNEGLQGPSHSSINTQMCVRINQGEKSSESTLKKPRKLPMRTNQQNKNQIIFFDKHLNKQQFLHSRRISSPTEEIKNLTGYHPSDHIHYSTSKEWHGILQDLNQLIFDDCQALKIQMNQVFTTAI